MVNPFDTAWDSLRKAWFDNEDFRGDPEDEAAYRAKEEHEFKNWHARQDHIEDILGREPTDDEIFGDEDGGPAIDELPDWKGAPPDHDHINNPWNMTEREELEAGGGDVGVLGAAVDPAEEEKIPPSNNNVKVQSDD